MRDASNGAAFLKQVAALGLKPRIVPGDEEAALSGLGVLSAIPEARRRRRRPWRRQPRAGAGWRRRRRARGCRCRSACFGSGSSPSRKAIAPRSARACKGTALEGSRQGDGLYLVGGSFRALAQLDLHETDHPLPIVHQHRLDAGAAAALERIIADHAADRTESARGAESSRARRACRRRRVILEAMVEVFGAGRGGGVGLRASRRAALPRSRPRDAAARIRCSRRRSKWANGSAGSAIMARRSTRGSRRCSPTTIRRRGGCGSRPACSAISRGTPTPIFAPSGRSTWRFMAIGSGSMPMAARCSAARCARPSAATWRFDKRSAPCSTRARKSARGLGPGDPPGAAAVGGDRGDASPDQLRGGEGADRAVRPHAPRRTVRRSGRAAAGAAGQSDRARGPSIEIA